MDVGLHARDPRAVTGTPVLVLSQYVEERYATELLAVLRYLEDRG